MKRLLLGLVLALLPTLAFAQGAQESIIRYYPPSGGGVAVGGTNVWTGSNTFTDSLFFLADDGDPTKKGQFQLSGLTTGTTRTWTMPDGNFTVAGLGLTQTWTAAQTFSGNVNISAATSLSLGATNPANNTATWSTVQTPDTGLLSTGSTGNSWVIVETADTGFDFAHAAATDPTLFIHSHNQNTTQWLSAYHDGTDAYVETGAGGVVLRSIGANIVYARNSGGLPTFRVPPTADLGFSSNAAIQSNANDAFFKRAAAASIQMGADVNGAAIAQTFKAHNTITGSNLGGADLILAAGVGTGTGAGAGTSLGRTLMTAAGTGAQTSTKGLTVCESKTLSNTSATVTSLAQVTLASNSSGAVRITVSVQCTDGTNFDSDLVTSYVSFVNKAGTITIGTPVTTGTSAANNSGSCTVAPTFTAGASLINVNVTPVITTIVPTTTTAYMNIENLGPGTVNCQ